VLLLGGPLEARQRVVVLVLTLDGSSSAGTSASAGAAVVARACGSMLLLRD
jgi:hypothetical protein